MPRPGTSLLGGASGQGGAGHGGWDQNMRPVSVGGRPLTGGDLMRTREHSLTREKECAALAVSPVDAPVFSARAPVATVRL